MLYRIKLSVHQRLHFRVFQQQLITVFNPLCADDSTCLWLRVLLPMYVEANIVKDVDKRDYFVFLVSCLLKESVHLIKGTVDDMKQVYLVGFLLHKLILSRKNLFLLHLSMLSRMFPSPYVHIFSYFSLFKTLYYLVNFLVQKLKLSRCFFLHKWTLSRVLPCHGLKLSITFF